MRIVTRAQWGARKPRSRKRIHMPSRDLWLHHTAGNEPDGPAGMRAIQNFHMDSRGWSDIAYSFVVDRNGSVFEGRGAGVAGAHTSGHNTTSHAICVMGHYEQRRPSQASLDAVAALVRHGYESGWWGPRITGGHRDASGASTTCPGRWLLDAIESINAAAAESEEPMGPRDVAYFQRILVRHYPERDGKGPPYDLDGENGTLGPKTRAALEDWQRRRGLEVTGTLNVATCCSLQSHANLAYVDRQ